MSEVTIREGRKEDCKAIVHLIAELAAYEGHDKYVDDIESFREDGFGENPWFHTFVAEVKDGTENATIVGFSLFYYSFSMVSGRSAHLECLYVVPEWRKHGLGIKLCKAVVQASQLRDCTSVEIGALEKNTRARNLYKRLGAVDFTEQMGARILIIDRTAMNDLLKSD